MQQSNLLNLVIIILGSVMVLSSCQKENSQTVSYTSDEYEELSKYLDIPGELYDYSIEIPFHLEQNVVIGPVDISKLNRGNHTITLGRVLFYDELLSRNGTVSCGSCHDQSAGFADNRVLSEGFDGETTVRNSLALGTTALGLTTSYGGDAGSFFPNSDLAVFGSLAGFSWDDSVHSMDEQTKKAIENPAEMGMTMKEMVDRVKSIAYYDILFRKAFGEDEINEENMLNAISSFVNAISSNKSKFDVGLEHTVDPSIDFASFTAKENLGKELYNSNCSSCHGLKHDFTVQAIGNNGLDVIYADKGKGSITGQSSDMGVFKIPFLRNIALSGPYMHDGRFNTLEEVVDFYSDNIQNHSNLDNKLKNFNGTAKRFNFDQNEKDALVAYLETLTDYELINDVKFADPFGK